MTLNYTLSLLAGFGMAVLLLVLMRRVAFRIGLVDHPDERKQHEGATPLVGGLSIFPAFVFAVLLLAQRPFALNMFFAALLLLLIVGILDDLHELPSWVRFVFQIAAALIMVHGDGIVLNDLGVIMPWGLWEMGWMAVPVTAFATVGMINATNMIDGVDGLTGVVTLVTVSALILLAQLAGDTPLALLLGLFAAVLFAFLLFNARLLGHHKASVFLGDAGSMCVGFLLCWFFVRMSQGPERIMPPVAALWLFGVPLMDTVTLLVRRSLKGRSPFSADREHLHHLLLCLGLGPRGVVAVIGLLSIAFAAVGVAGSRLGWPEFPLFAAFMAIFILYYVGTARYWRRIEAGIPLGAT